MKLYSNLTDFLQDADLTEKNYFIADSRDMVFFSVDRIMDLDVCNYPLVYGGALVSTDDPYNAYLYLYHDDFTDLVNRVKNHEQEANSYKVYEWL